MTTKLDELLETIDPTRTYEETSKRVDAAFDTFRIPAARLTGWDAFKRCMTAFFRHVQNRVLRADTSFTGDAAMDWFLCTKVMCDIYGRNGEKAAFEMARTGNEGGLYAVLKAVAERVAEECAEAAVRTRICRFWDDLAASERLSAVEEYLEKWDHLLPSEITEGSAARIKADFPRVLEEHPRIIGRMRRIGR